VEFFVLLRRTGAALSNDEIRAAVLEPAGQEAGTS
jgi:hypothetical protein